MKTQKLISKVAAQRLRWYATTWETALTAQWTLVRLCSCSWIFMRTALIQVYLLMHRWQKMIGHSSLLVDGPSVCMRCHLTLIWTTVLSRMRSTRETVQDWGFSEIITYRIHTLSKRHATDLSRKISKNLSQVMRRMKTHPPPKASTINLRSYSSNQSTCLNSAWLWF